MVLSCPIESQRSIAFFSRADLEEDPVNSGFVNWGMQFTELEEALLPSFDVVAPSVNLCVVIYWVGVFFVEKILEELTGVAVHARYAWLD